MRCCICNKILERPWIIERLNCHGNDVFYHYCLVCSKKIFDDEIGVVEEDVN